MSPIPLFCAVYFPSFTLPIHFPIFVVALPNYVTITETACSRLPELNTETIGVSFSILLRFFECPSSDFLRPFHTHPHCTTTADAACASGAATTATRARPGDGGGDCSSTRSTTVAATSESRDAHQRAGEYAHRPFPPAHTHLPTACQQCKKSPW